MSFDIGDRVYVVSRRVDDGHLYGESGQVIRTDGPVWPYGVLLDKKELNCRSGFNWLATDEIEPEQDSQLTAEETNRMLRKALREALERAEDAEDAYEFLLADVEGSRQEDSSAELAAHKEALKELKAATSELLTEFLFQAHELDELREIVDEQLSRNEELCAELLKEKAKQKFQN